MRRDADGPERRHRPRRGEARRPGFVNEDPGGEFTVIGYSQGAIVANFLLNDIADGVVNVDRSHFNAIHLHLVSFRVLSRSGRQPGPFDSGLKDCHPVKRWK